MSSEEFIYLYRRKGQDAWVTCDAVRYTELSGNHFFEVRVARDQHDYAALEAELGKWKRSYREVHEPALREAHAYIQELRAELAKVLGNVEREHDLIRQMKNCEIHRGRGSFGIAVMSDPLALDWQALDKELQQLIDARRTALAASTGQEVK